MQQTALRDSKKAGLALTVIPAKAGIQDVFLNSVKPLSLFILLFIFLPACADDWKSRANERIEQIRKRDVQLRLTDSDNKSLAGAKVEVRQVKHSFPFGSALSKTLLTNEKYRDFFKSHFNWAAFENETKWYSNEHFPGRMNYSLADAMYDWCKANNIPVRGHCIFWAPEKWQMQWMRNLDSDELRRVVERRLHSVVTHFKGKFVHWDVNNEMLHGSFFKDNLGDAIRLWMFKKTHELDPEATLFINEFNILSVDKDFTEVQTQEYIAHIKSFLDQGAQIHAIGIQGHIWSEDIIANPNVLKERLDLLAKLNLPIWITEFDVADPDQRARADKLEIVYRTAYSHPAVEGIMMWVFWAGNSWRGPDAAIVNRDWTLNEAGGRYEALMKEWTTTASGETDHEGAFSFRGFHGSYEVTIEPPGKDSICKSFTLEPGNTVAKIVLSTDSSTPPY